MAGSKRCWEMTVTSRPDSRWAAMISSVRSTVISAGFSMITSLPDRSASMASSPWVPVGVQRGFAALAEHFLTSVRAGQVLDAADALATHRLCERVVDEVEAALGRPS